MQNVMSSGENGFASAIGSPKLPKVWIDVCDGRGDFVFGWLNAEELDQVRDDLFGLRGQFGELDLEDRNVGMRFDESITVFEQTPLQTLAGLIVGSEPLTAMLVGSILQTADRGFDVAVRRR